MMSLEDVDDLVAIWTPGLRDYGCYRTGRFADPFCIVEKDLKFVRVGDQGVPDDSRET